MKKWQYALIGVVALSLVIVGFIGISFIVIKTNPAKNVFDEIYYDEYNSSKGKFEFNTGSTLALIEGINKVRYDSINLRRPVMEEYKEEFYPSNIMRIAYSFGFDDKTVSLNYTMKITDKLRLVNNNVYSVDDRKIVQHFYIIDDNQVDDVFIRDISEIEAILQQYGISKEEVRELTHEVFYDIMLTDWFNAKPSSRFSLEDLGDIKIESSELLK